MFNLVDLKDKKILVVGASQGIGEQIAITLSKLGAQIILASRNEEKLKNVLQKLEGEAEHQYCCLDVKKLEQIENCIKEFVEEIGSLDGMVYCAGITGDRPLSMSNISAVAEVLQVNLQGFIEMVRCVTKKGRYNSGMRIVGISSTSSLRGGKAHTAYSASKAGMDGAIRSMAVELAEKGICINSVAPAAIKTEMYEKYMNGVGKNTATTKLERQYLGIGLPEDVANAVAFLISPAARLITGVCLPVDGGSLSN